MSYKISGTLNESARILVLKESDWSIESNIERSAGDYEIENLVSGTKTVVAIDNSGEIVGYGGVSPKECINGVGDRGVFGGGYDGINKIKLNNIDYITISSPGNATDFGDLTVEAYVLSATSNGINDRGVFGGGYSQSNGPINIIDYITISIIDNAIDFGDLIAKRYCYGSISNGTNNRGVFGGGFSGGNTIEYITISSLGNATYFGNLGHKKERSAATSNAINDRGVFAGEADKIAQNIIDYITISSLGNASVFGTLTKVRYSIASTSNGINNRGVFAGGHYNNAYSNVIDYITISSLGNATDFGDLLIERRQMSATSNCVNNRGVFGGGYNGTNFSHCSNLIDYINISTTGNTVDFGDLTVCNRGMGGTSNC